MKRIRVKFCGITSKEDAEKAVALGVDALGFIFFKDSPRYVTPDEAGEIIKDLPPFVDSVGIFVNEDIDFVEDCIEQCGLNVVQLHGDEDVDYCQSFASLKFVRGTKLIKAIRVKDESSLRAIESCPADAILLDTYKSNFYGGTGKTFDTTLALLAREYGRRLILAGGLNPSNVHDVILEAKPYAVDVSSGIEASPGKKNDELMEEFINEVRRAEQSL
ncbi:MAG: phosphoribosylanthranilate isomerase [Candidatus Omnitrophota bacterium]|jgi:phosphoribosylanthranilate isomerase|nr:phosphoribosylanthranilate isomerase [Candidatus Omnitrophota bacterium]